LSETVVVAILTGAIPDVGGNFKFGNFITIHL